MPPGSDGWNMNKLKWPVIGGVGGKRPSIVQGKEPWARQPGRQTEPRPHGSQEMSVSNRNCVSSFDFCPFTLASASAACVRGFASTRFFPLPHRCLSGKSVIGSGQLPCN